MIGKPKTLTMRHVIVLSLTQTVMFVIGYIVGLIIRDVVLGVKSAVDDIVKDNEAAPYGKALFQIFLNSFLIIYVSEVLDTNTLMFSIGLFAAQAKLLGVAIFENVDEGKKPIVKALDSL